MTIRNRLLIFLLPPISLFFAICMYFLFYLMPHEAIHNKFTVLFAGGIIFFLVILSIFLIADFIGKPLRQLNQASLDIAAGDYGESIQVKGPTEIVELANTLNTMSECLVEHLNRLRESSVVRERMHGEYECALLLQTYMLAKQVQNFDHPIIRLRLASLPLASLQKGLFLKIDPKPNDSLLFTLLEAEEEGFAGLFKLNQYAHLHPRFLKNQSFVQCKFVNHYRTLLYWSHYLLSPFIWSIKLKKMIKKEKAGVSIQDQDMVFLFNSAFIEHFHSEEAIENWLSRILRHFAEDGLDTIYTMIMNELNFIGKKQHPGKNFQILCMQISYPSS